MVVLLVVGKRISHPEDRLEVLTDPSNAAK